jgi:hypothetical protein
MEGNDDEGTPRLVARRRLVSFVAGVVAYAAVLAAVGSDPAGTTYTTHTVRYLVLVAVFYAFLSGVNVAYGYVADSDPYEDATDFVGGASALVGLGIFYAEVLGTGADTATEGANVLALGFVTVATVAGMLLILKF